MALADSRESQEQVEAVLPGLVGTVLSDVTLRADDLSLAMDFSNGTTVALQYAPNMGQTDQWFIELPWDVSLGAYAGRRWRLAANPRTPW